MRAAPLLAELHHGADVLLAGTGSWPGCRAPRRAAISAAVGHVGGRVDDQLAAVGQVDVVLDVRRRGEQLQVVLALEPLAHDVHVQQAEEAAAEAEAERLARLRLPGERGVVQLQLLERVAQVGELVGLDREQAAEHHRLDLAVARQRLGGRAGLGGERVAHAQLRHVLDAGDEVADLAGAQRLDRHHLRAEEADLVDLGLGAGLHGPDRSRPCAARRRPRGCRRPRRGTGRTRSRR